MGLPGVALSVSLTLASSPKGRAKNVAVKPLPLTLGEVASRRDDGEGYLTTLAGVSIIETEKVLTGKRLVPHRQIIAEE